MCNHISVVLPNRPGEFARLAASLAQIGVNILGHQTASQGNSSIVHLLCDPHDQAFEKLRTEYRFYCNQKRVVVLPATHVPGELSAILQSLANTDFNLESSYQAIINNQVLLVFELRDREVTEQAEELLRQANLRVLEHQPVVK